MYRNLQRRNPECDWCFCLLQVVRGEDYNDYYKCPQCGETTPMPQPNFDDYDDLDYLN